MDRGAAEEAVENTTKKVLKRKIAGEIDFAGESISWAGRIKSGEYGGIGTDGRMENRKKNQAKEQNSSQVRSKAFKDGFRAGKTARCPRS